jgi:hypothetical protein
MILNNVSINETPKEGKPLHPIVRIGNAYICRWRNRLVEYNGR